MKQPDMENRFYRELSRRLAEEGISTDQPGEKGPPVLHDSRPAVFISALGLAYMPGGEVRRKGNCIIKEDFAVRAGLVPKELLVSRRPPETPDPVRSRDPEEYGREALRELGADQELLDTLEGFTDFAALGRLCMEQDGIHSEAPEMEML